MLNLLRQLNAKLESMEAKKLLVILVNIFLVFLFVGLIIGYIRDSRLKKDEMLTNTAPNASLTPQKNSYQGRVMYLDPKQYEADGIKYALYDTKGNEIILLKATDQKLELLEGIFVTVRGDLVKAKVSKKNVLIVSEVIMNAAN